MNPQELLEFAAALAKSIDCMCIAYPGDPRLLEWTRELLEDAIECHSLDDDQARVLKSEVWQRLKPATQAELQALKQGQEVTA